MQRAAVRRRQQGSSRSASSLSSGKLSLDRPATVLWGFKVSRKSLRKLYQTLVGAAARQIRIRAAQARRVGDSLEEVLPDVQVLDVEGSDAAAAVEIRIQVCLGRRLECVLPDVQVLDVATAGLVEVAVAPVAVAVLIRVAVQCARVRDRTAVVEHVRNSVAVRV